MFAQKLRLYVIVGMKQYLNELWYAQKVMGLKINWQMKEALRL